MIAQRLSVASSRAPGGRRSGCDLAFGLATIATLVAASGCHRDRRDDPAPSPVGHFHRVAPGETLASIAQRERVPLQVLIEANAVTDPNRIFAGTELFIPDTERRGPDDPFRRRFPRTLVAGSMEGRGGEPERHPLDQGPPMSWPVIAPISSTFGVRDGRPHQGIDLRVPDGTEVSAAADGIVIYAGDRLRGYGRLVILRHTDALVTVYAHNERLLVAEGQGVRRGQVISRSGHTGHVTAPHLHFEVRVDNIPRDPMSFLAHP